MTITIHTETNRPSPILCNRAEGKGYKIEVKKTRLAAVNE